MKALKSKEGSVFKSWGRKRSQYPRTGVKTIKLFQKA